MYLCSISCILTTRTSSETKIDAAAAKNGPGVPRGIQERPWGSSEGKGGLGLAQGTFVRLWDKPVLINFALSILPKYEYVSVYFNSSFSSSDAEGPRSSGKLIVF